MTLKDAVARSTPHKSVGGRLNIVNAVHHPATGKRTVLRAVVYEDVGTQTLKLREAVSGFNSACTSGRLQHLGQKGTRRPGRKYEMDGEAFAHLMQVAAIDSQQLVSAAVSRLRLFDEAGNTYNTAALDDAITAHNGHTALNPSGRAARSDSTGSLGMGKFGKPVRVGTMVLQLSQGSGSTREDANPQVVEPAVKVATYASSSLERGGSSHSEKQSDLLVVLTVQQDQLNIFSSRMEAKEDNAVRDDTGHANAQSTTQMKLTSEAHGLNPSTSALSRMDYDDELVIEVQMMTT
ncbi:hypothetical protein BC830DRAFT_1082475 [Chytriomyces sp. MP71]|nr:hypothetical protein BC830DRAFT_1082475 [Chytriomyces sp. MP71]